MADLTFSDDVAEQLRALAAREGRSVEDVVREMMKQYAPAHEADAQEQDDEDRPGSGARLLKSALAADIHLEASDLASRSREILDKEFPEYLRRRLDESLDPDNG